jgi:SnoaL-like domain
VSSPTRLSVTSLFHAIDDLDWIAAREALAPNVDIDYTSLWGGQPDRLDAQTLLSTWGDLLPGFDATQHLLGPILATPTSHHALRCAAAVRGYHVIRTPAPDEAPAGTWMVAGRYTIDLTLDHGAWRVRAITLHVAYEDGDRTLVDVARGRVATGAGGRTTAAAHRPPPTRRR